MPVEINEIVITATINDHVQGNNSPVQGSNGSGNTAAIVKACVEEVLRVLKEKEER